MEALLVSLLAFMCFVVLLFIALFDLLSEAGLLFVLLISVLMFRFVWLL